MAATTRARTGNSKPRIVQQIENVVAPKKRTTTTTKTKANTSKPRTSKVTTGRVAKPKTTSTTKTTTTKSTAAGPRTKTVKKPRTKTEKVIDKVAGKIEKADGEVTGRPGKKAAGTAKARGTDSTTKRAAPKAKKV
ncbi:hypothetical protein N0V83_001117 [Neocucurbitaria cava]|uniref:Uncharacterized protein n=1 Tax=Neocucurbitaria cava TaxID=798079 RepID=A0A9W8YEP8_9PLEO|nr:hypothetical protein N0V83_001117 [Neocucurbitaria cava]